eukprot:TRINITY_DN62924_c0_g1_i1.p1 TRINITY_DN62924_c0_g1~~TRINITY_DN62924_c0_g1_i1.p1  ORF type:complete len:454 (+),score=104.69 TRINITY_DN62924_c0_g1_i1:82-1443(+)
MGCGAAPKALEPPSTQAWDGQSGSTSASRSLGIVPSGSADDDVGRKAEPSSRSGESANVAIRAELTAELPGVAGESIDAETKAELPAELHGEPPSRSAVAPAEKESISEHSGLLDFGAIKPLLMEQEAVVKDENLDISLSSLAYVALVGTGTFSTVRLVRSCQDGSRFFALRTLSKDQVERERMQTSVLQEREILSQCSHPFVVQFVRTLQDDACIHFLMEFLAGGDLFCAMRELDCISRVQAQFFSACVVLALGYLHGQGIIYRDLKPENVLLDPHGYGKLVDLGRSKKTDRATTLTGTPQYTAPEVIQRCEYTCSVDWWALGVLMFELLVGPLPFGNQADDQLEVFLSILDAPLEFPSDFNDKEAISILSGLLQRLPEARVGSSTRGSQELQEHAFFVDFDWTALSRRQLTAPWKPDLDRVQGRWVPAADERIEVSHSPASPSRMEWASVF